MNPLLLIRRTNGELYLLLTLAKQIVKSVCGKSIEHRVHISDRDIRNCRFVPTIRIDENIEIDSYYKDICDLFINHKFDLLGSGWLDVNCSSEQQDATYKRIDWHRDWKSGYTFDANIRSSKLLNITLPKGVDVKYPWELARMQHLTLLAITAIKEKDNSDIYFNEFKNEILDFIDANPVSLGINWACTMDVALRCTCWLIAYDIFYTTIGKKDADFDKAFIKSILEHGDFITHNLEKNFTEDKSGNHYLSNLLGLLCIGHYFRSKKTRRWFDFAAREYKREIIKQYLPDGGNYEFSTAYHRLDSELTALSVGLMRANEVELADTEIKRLCRSMDFMQSIIGLDGSIIQIGDNDNGHAIIFSAEYNSDLQKNELSGNAALNMLATLFGQHNSAIESHIMRSFIRDDKVIAYFSEKPQHISNCLEVPKMPYNETHTINVTCDQIYSANIFEDFGLVKFCTDSYEIYVRTPMDVSKGKTTHLHADCLHTEIVTHTHRLFADQGSYAYTPDIEMRNIFRSDNAHNIPQYDVKQLEITGCWNAKCCTSGRILHCNSTNLVVMMNLQGISHIREIEISTNGIVIADSGNTTFKSTPKHFQYISNGYGDIHPNNMI